MSGTSAGMSSGVAGRRVMFASAIRRPALALSATLCLDNENAGLKARAAVLPDYRSMCLLRALWHWRFTATGSDVMCVG